MSLNWKLNNILKDDNYEIYTTVNLNWILTQHLHQQIPIWKKKLNISKKKIVTRHYSKRFSRQSNSFLWISLFLANPFTSYHQVYKPYKINSGHICLRKCTIRSNGNNFSIVLYFLQEWSQIFIYTINYRCIWKKALNFFQSLKIF